MLAASTNRFADLDKYELRYLAVHLREAGHHEKLCSLLTELGFDFIEARCSQGEVFELLEDYSQAGQVLSDVPALAQMEKALSLVAPSISERPNTALQAVYNQLLWFDRVDPRLKTRIEEVYAQLNKRGPWIRAEAPLPGSRFQANTIPFNIESCIQAMSANCETIAIVSMSGDVEIHDLVDQIPKKSLVSNCSRIALVAFDANVQSVAQKRTLDEGSLCLVYMDETGTIVDWSSHARLEGRSGDQRLAYHHRHGALAVRKDNVLVAWQPCSDYYTVLDVDLPFPLITLRITPSGDRVVYVAGYKNQRIGIACWTGSEWTTKLLPYQGPAVVDADLDISGECILLVCQDRSLRLVNLRNDELSTRTNYEAQADVIVRGEPVRCALGSGISQGWGFVATKQGQIVAWNWAQDVLRRLENYRTLTESNVSLCSFEVLPDGRLFFSTEDHGEMVGLESSRIVATDRHSAPVTGCFITDSGQIVSASHLDNSIRRFSVEGLVPVVDEHQQAQVRYQTRVTAIAKVPNSDDVLVGDYRGWVWRQPWDRDVESREIFLLPKAVASLFAVDDNTAIVADSQGHVFLVEPKEDKAELLRPGSGTDTQISIFPAGETGLCWSLYKREEGDIGHVFSLIEAKGIERPIHKARYILAAAVTQDGNTLCLAGSAVQVFHREGATWIPFYSRAVSVKHVAFIGEADWLVAVPANSHWLEIWQVAPNLPMLAEIRLPGEVSCISTRGDRIIVGFASGDIASLRLCGQRTASSMLKPRRRIVRLYRRSKQVDMVDTIGLCFWDADHGRVKLALDRLKDLEEEIGLDAKISYAEGVIRRDFLGRGIQAYQLFVQSYELDHQHKLAACNAANLAPDESAFRKWAPIAKRLSPEDAPALDSRLDALANGIRYMEILHGMGVAAYQELGEYGGSAACLELALHLGGMRSDEEITTRQMRAHSLRELDRQAEQFRATVAEAFPPDERLALQEALVELDRAIALDEYDPELWNLKSAWCVLLSRYDEALVCADKSIELRPHNYPKPHQNKAVALYNLDRYDKALACAREALRHAEDRQRLEGNGGDDVIAARKTTAMCETPVGAISPEILEQNATKIIEAAAVTAKRFVMKMQGDIRDLAGAFQWRISAAMLDGRPSIQYVAPMAQLLAYMPPEAGFAVLQVVGETQPVRFARSLEATLYIAVHGEPVMQRDAARLLALTILGQENRENARLMSIHEMRKAYRLGMLAPSAASDEMSSLDTVVRAEIKRINPLFPALIAEQEPVNAQEIARTRQAILANLQGEPFINDSTNFEPRSSQEPPVRKRSFIEFKENPNPMGCMSCLLGLAATVAGGIGLLIHLIFSLPEDWQQGLGIVLSIGIAALLLALLLLAPNIKWGGNNRSAMPGM